MSGTGNTNSPCQYCGESHHPLAACFDDKLKGEISRLKAEVERFEAIERRLRADIDLWDVLASHRSCNCHACDDLLDIAQRRIYDDANNPSQTRRLEMRNERKRTGAFDDDCQPQITD